MGMDKINGKVLDNSPDVPVREPGKCDIWKPIFFKDIDNRTIKSAVCHVIISILEILHYLDHDILQTRELV